jgi:hypothetical protein
MCPEMLNAGMDRVNISSRISSYIIPSRHSQASRVVNEELQDNNMM